MRTTAATRQDLATVERKAPVIPADITSAPKVLEWAVYIREHVKLSIPARSLSFLLITLGQGQNITMSIVGMADSTGMSRNTVKVALKELLDHGLITVKDIGRNQKLVYRLTIPRWSGDDHQGGQEMTTKVVSISPPGGQEMTTTSREDQEIDQHLHQHADDDVVVSSSSREGQGQNRAKATARSGSSARDDHPVSLEAYLDDIDGCADELAARLGLDPGHVNHKALAKFWRDLMIHHGHTYGLSGALEAFPPDHEMWSRCARAQRPVGYFLSEIGRDLDDSGR